MDERRLYKVRIEGWIPYHPDTEEISTIAREMESGGGICTRTEVLKSGTIEEVKEILIEDNADEFFGIWEGRGEI